MNDNDEGMSLRRGIDISVEVGAELNLGKIKSVCKMPYVFIQYLWG